MNISLILWAINLLIEFLYAFTLITEVQRQFSFCPLAQGCVLVVRVFLIFAGGLSVKLKCLIATPAFEILAWISAPESLSSFCQHTC